MYRPHARARPFKLLPTKRLEEYRDSPCNHSPSVTLVDSVRIFLNSFRGILYNLLLYAIRYMITRQIYFYLILLFFKLVLRVCIRISFFL